MVLFVNYKTITCKSQVSFCLHICSEHVWKEAANNGSLSGWCFGKCCAILYVQLVVPVVCVCVCVFKVSPMEDELSWPLHPGYRNHLEEEPGKTVETESLSVSVKGTEHFSETGTVYGLPWCLRQ